MMPVVTEKLCEFEGCENPRRQSSGRGRPPLFCDEHSPSPQPKMKAEAKPKSVGNININIKPPNTKKQDAEKLLAERAKLVMEWSAAVVKLALSQHADAATLAVGAEPWGQAVGRLAPHEPWLARLAEGGPSDRVSAWLGVAMATTPIALAILIHHDLLPHSALDFITPMLGDLA